MYIKNMVMRFENLVFLSHPVTPKSGIMAKINLDNGKELSVICGEGFYSSSRKGNRALCTSVEDAASFEVMIDDEVLGWQSRDQITKLMKEYGKK